MESQVEYDKRLAAWRSELSAIRLLLDGLNKLGEALNPGGAAWVLVRESEINGLRREHFVANFREDMGK